MPTSPSQLNFETIIPASLVSVVYSFVTIPAFSYSGIGWKGASEVVTQFNYSSSKNFIIRELPEMPEGANFVPVISWRHGLTTYRYKLWAGIGERLAEVLYTGQVIKKNFKIEIWNIETSQSVDLTEALVLTTSIRSLPANLSAIADVEESASTEVADQIEQILAPSSIAGYLFQFDYLNTTLDGGNINPWLDNSAAFSLAQGTVGLQPLASQLFFGALTDLGKFVPTFDGVDDVLAVAASAYNVRHLFVVFKNVANDGLSLFKSVAANGLQLLGNGAGGLRFNYAGSTKANLAMDAGGEYVAEFSLDVAAGSPYPIYCGLNNLYGNLLSANGTSVTDLNSSIIELGPSSKMIVEVLGFTNKLSASDRLNVLGYIGNKYVPGGFILPNQWDSNIPQTTN